MPTPAPLEGTGPVVARALRILGAFSPDRRAMTLSEISRCSGLPVSTVHRIAAELAGWGALERDAHGCYHIGLRLWEIGSLAPRGLGLRECALPFLEDLSHVTRENVQLAVREDTELVFVERIAGSRAVPVLTRVGGRFALTATGVGLVLLAHAPDEVLERVLARPIPRFTERTMTEARIIRAALADTRTRGYAVSDQQVTMDALSVAAPIHDSRGDVVAAVSLVVRRGGVAPHMVAQLLLTSARAISRALPSAAPDQ
ncbi:IclR family transcriptional regulator [Actinomadura macra]|uniref:IclR family transcriptional regulator n=1 Tax=Actinomadura macra TaxID=46164 RepID=UPI000829D41A|nr:IclR family transcriptional regulator [Actinomadura macra]